VLSGVRSSIKVELDGMACTEESEEKG